MQQAYFRLRLLCDHREICGQVSIITIPCNATRVSVSIFLSAPSGLSRRSPLSLAWRLLSRRCAGALAIVQRAGLSAARGCLVS